jgi:phosphoglycolate phosphatase
MVLGFCDAVGLEPGQVMVCGDNRHDLEMGRSAGAGMLVGVLTGTSSHEHLRGLADHVVDSIADIEALL